MSYILDFNKDISFLGLLMLRTQFEKIYKRPYVLEFFTSKNIHKRYNNEDPSTWVEESIDYKEGKTYKRVKVSLSKDELINLFYIIDKIYYFINNDYNREKRKKDKEEKEEKKRRKKQRKKERKQKKKEKKMKKKIKDNKEKKMKKKKRKKKVKKRKLKKMKKRKKKKKVKKRKKRKKKAKKEIKVKKKVMKRKKKRRKKKLIINFSSFKYYLIFMI